MSNIRLKPKDERNRVRKEETILCGPNNYFHWQRLRSSHDNLFRLAGLRYSILVCSYLNKLLPFSTAALM